jgi:YHS domain-containing protein
MRQFLQSALVLALSAVAAAQTPGSGPIDALDGLDPVLLVQGKEVPGKSAISALHDRFLYLFSSPETKATFEREPAKYAIQFGGLCARMGRTTGGNPADFLVHDGKIYIFGSDECHKRFAAAPDKYIPSPPAPLPTSKDAARRGRLLLDQAANTMAPAKTLDGVTSFVETIVQTQPRPQGTATVATKTMWLYPDRVRQDRSMTMMGKTMESSTVFAPEGMWFVTGQGQAFPMSPAARPALQLEYGRHPIALLRARHDPGFKGFADGEDTIDGTAIRRVRIVHEGLDVRLNLDRTNRVHSVAFRERNAEGVYGDYVVLYSDYTPADGLLIPFSVRALFDGKPDPFQSWTVESAAVNTPLDRTLFAAPARRP